MLYFKAKMYQNRFLLGLCPRLCWGSLWRSLRPLAGFKGPTPKEGEGLGPSTFMTKFTPMILNILYEWTSSLLLNFSYVKFDNFFQSRQGLGLIIFHIDLKTLFLL